jgi:hypothetical protein
MGATPQFSGVCAADDEWLCYTTVWKDLLSNKEKTAFHAHCLRIFLVGKALQAYQLVITDDDCSLFAIPTVFQQDDLLGKPRLSPASESHVVRLKVRLEACIGQGGRHESTDSTLQDLSEASNGSSGEV